MRKFFPDCRTALLLLIYFTDRIKNLLQDLHCKYLFSRGKYVEMIIYDNHVTEMLCRYNVETGF